MTGSTGIPMPPVPKKLDVVRENLLGLVNRTDDVIVRVQALVERFCPSEPEEVTQSTPKNIEEGIPGELLDIIDRVDYRIAQIGKKLNRLEGV